MGIVNMMMVMSATPEMKDRNVLLSLPVKAMIKTAMIIKTIMRTEITLMAMTGART
jgi:hypothetical protein